MEGKDTDHPTDRSAMSPCSQQSSLNGADNSEPLPAEDVRRLLQQCTIHQGELEAQNSELRRVRQQLERFRDRYVHLYDFAPLGYVTLDEDGYVQEINLAGARMLSVQRDSLIGYPFVDYVAEADQPAFLDHVRRCVQQHEEVTSEVTLQTNGGRTIAVQLHSVPTEDDDQQPDSEENRQTTFCKTAVTDITQRKLAERQLRALNETLEQRVAERAAELHRRATQLRVLTLQLTQIEQRERRRLAQILQDRLQQLLIAARISLSGLEVQLGEQPPQQSVARVQRFLEQAIAESQTLTVELSPPVLYEAGLAAGLEWLAHHMQRDGRLLVHVQADRQAEPAEESVRGFLFEAVRELLANVAKHAHVDQASVTMARDGQSHVCIEVHDTGVGFDPADLRSREATVGGAFGLFGVRERLEVLGGSLQIISAPSQGTRIVMRAPLQQQSLHEAREPSVVTSEPADVAPEPRPIHSAAVAGVIRVLLADDHSVIRHGLAELLQRQPGIEVVGEAADGEEAVALARKTRPDVILMDVIMPKLDGVEATRQIKSRFPETRIIALSMYDEGEMPAAMYDAGVARYLSKAVAPELLVAAVLDQGE